MTADPAVRVRGLRRAYGPRVVLDAIDLDIAPGEFVALIGKTGGGKSTLLRALAGLDHGYEGTINAPPRRTVVFQDARLLPWLTALGNVVLGLPGRESRALGRAALAEVGLTERADAWPLTLSGGEAQRVALARALVREPELLLLDEPFRALDALTRIQMYQLLRALRERHRPAVMLVTHDVDEALVLADRVLVLRDGAILLDVPVELDQASRQRDPRFIDQRARLLAALGVT